MMKSYLRYEPKETFGIIASPQANVIYDFSGHLAITSSVRNVTVWNLRQASQVTSDINMSICNLLYLFNFHLTKVIGLVNDHPNYPYELSGEVTVLARCFDKNKPCVAVGYSDGLINIYNYITKALVTSFRGHISAISCLIDLSVNSNSSLSSVNKSNKQRQSDVNKYYLASGGCDCSIIIWDLISLSAVCKLRGHKDAVTDLTFLNANNRKFLISVSKDTLMKVWCMETQSCVQTIVGHRCEIWSVSLVGSLWSTTENSTSESTLTVVTGGSDDVLRGYSVITHASTSSTNTEEDTKQMSDSSDIEEMILKYIGNVSTLCGQEKIVRLCMNPSGSLLAAQSSGKIVEMFAIRDYSEVKKKMKRRLKRSRDKLSKSSTEDGFYDNPTAETQVESIQLSDILESFTVLRCLHPVRGFDFCPTNQTVSAGRDAGNDTAMVSLIRNILEVYSIPSPISRISENDTDHADRQPVKTSLIDLHGHRSDVRCVALSGDGRTVATCSSDGLKLWSMTTLTCLRSCDCGYGVTLNFAPGSRYVILGTKDGLVQLIDTVSGKYNLP